MLFRSGFYVSSLSKIILRIGQFWKFALVAPSENQPESHSSAILFADMQFFAKVEARIIIASYQLGHDPTRILILITVSANDPYLHPGG